MKAVLIHNYGSSEALKYEDTAVPEIAGNQVLVKVYAASVNHLDIKKAAGGLSDKFEVKLPWIPGYDFAGIVQKVGSQVAEFEVGDEVYGNCNGGSYAEYLAADVSKTVKKPTNISFVDAASVPHVAETAWQALYTHGNFRSGEKVLIHGAAGAVGAYAVQFAHAGGAFIYASASASDKNFLESLHADVIIDYRTEDFTEIAKDIDLVLDFVGGDTLKKSYSVIKQGGRLVNTTGQVVSEEAEEHCVIATSMVIQQSGQDLEIITRMIQDGEVQTDVASVYPLSEAADAWDNFLGADITISTRMHGKIVLQPVDPPSSESRFGEDFTEQPTPRKESLNEDTLEAKDGIFDDEYLSIIPTIENWSVGK